MITQQPIAQLAILDQFQPQPHARERRLKIMADRRQQLRALGKARPRPPLRYIYNWYCFSMCWKWLKVAEKWLKKGSSVYIEGKIRSRKWEDKEGNTRYTTEILADNMTMLGKKEDSSAEKTETTPEQESIPQEEKGDDLPF